MDSQRATEIAVAVVRLGDRVLIGTRPKGVPLAGYLEFPGGKIRAQELPTEAAVRECLEETGLVTLARRTIAVVDHCYEHGALRLHFVDAIPAGPPVPPRPPFQWIRVTELDANRFPPANAGVIAALKAED